MVEKLLDWFTKVDITYQILAEEDNFCAYAKITTIKRPWYQLEVHKERRFAKRDVVYWRDHITGEYLPF